MTSTSGRPGVHGTRVLHLVAGSWNAIRRALAPSWCLLLPVCGVWGLAGIRLLVDPTPRVPLLFNWTGSLPYRVGWLQPTAGPLHRGDLIVYAFAGDARDDVRGLAGQPFFKVVRGLPGDTVTVNGRAVSVNGDPVGTAKTHTHDHRPLAPIEPGVIPPGRYYVQGTSADSFDSRYRSSGLVGADQVIGRVIPLL